MGKVMYKNVCNVSYHRRWMYFVYDFRGFHPYSAMLFTTVMEIGANSHSIPMQSGQCSVLIKDIQITILAIQRLMQDAQASGVQHHEIELNKLDHVQIPIDPCASHETIRHQQHNNIRNEKPSRCQSYGTYHFSR